MRYAFIKEHEPRYPARRLCHVMAVNRSGYYAWRQQPVTTKHKENQRLTGLIKQFWLESGGVYGYRKITDDLHAKRAAAPLRATSALLRGSITSLSAIALYPDSATPLKHRIKSADRLLGNSGLYLARYTGALYSDGCEERITATPGRR